LHVTFYAHHIEALSIFRAFMKILREDCTHGVCSMLYVTFQQKKNKSKCSLSSIPLIFGKNGGLSINEEITF
jgi:hypothetical protein